MKEFIKIFALVASFFISFWGWIAFIDFFFLINRISDAEAESCIDLLLFSIPAVAYIVWWVLQERKPEK